MSLAKKYKKEVIKLSEIKAVIIVLFLSVVLIAFDSWLYRGAVIMFQLAFIVGASLKLVVFDSESVKIGYLRFGGTIEKWEDIVMVVNSNKGENPDLITYVFKSDRYFAISKIYTKKYRHIRSEIEEIIDNKKPDVERAVKGIL